MFEYHSPARPPADLWHNSIFPVYLQDERPRRPAPAPERRAPRVRAAGVRASSVAGRERVRTMASSVALPEGCWPTMITPYNDEGKIDYHTLKALIGTL